MKACTTEDFIKKANVIHGNKYDYSITKYINSDTKIKIICKKHGIFEQVPYHHLAGHCCKKCSVEIGGAKLILTYDEFVKNAKVIHKNKYNYEKSVYKNAKEKIIITCPQHGDFLQTPDAHCHGAGCQKCAELIIKKNHDDSRMTTEEFIKKSKKLFKNLYTYCKTSYGKNYKEKVTITCPIHGDFRVSACNHLGNKRGCPYCGKTSKGEETIALLLTRHHVAYTHQKWFDDFRNVESGRPYRFDFYIIEKT